MWDIRCDLVDMTENLILKQFKNIIRRRGDTDLFKLALRLIAVQQVHNLQHKQLYEKPIRDKLGAVKTMALTTSKIEELHQQLLTQSQDDFQAYCDTTNSSEDFISAEETTEIDRETAKCGRNNDCHRDYTEHLNDLAGYAEVNDIIQSDSEVSTNEEVEPAARMSQLQQYSGGDIYYCPPKNLTDEEIRLYLDNLDSCIIQRSNSTVIEHSWTSLAAIFNKHAQYPEQFIKRTIWPRTYDRLRNRYFNDGLHKKRKLDDSSSCIINCSDSNSMIISSCGNMNSSLSESDNFNFNSTSNDMQTTAAIDNEEPPSNMLSISTVKSGPLEEEELIWLRAKGKQLKEEGVENITGIMLSVAYLKQFKIYKRNGTDLATAWQKYFKNQKDTPSAWYRTFSQNRSMRKQCVSNDKTI